MAEARPRGDSPPSRDPLSIQDEDTKRARKLREAHRDLKDFHTSESAQLRYPRSSIDFINLAIVERPQDKAKDDASSFLQATIHGIDQYCSGVSKKIEYGKLLDSVSDVSGKRVALIGAPGCGKTTLARKLCRDLYSQHLPNRYHLVLYVELRNLRSHLIRSKGNAEIGLPFILKTLGLPGPEDLSATIEEQHGQGVALILDGYDEIADDPNLSHWVSGLFAKESLYLYKCDMFVTTRPSHLRTLTDRLGEDITLMEIIGFTIENIHNFIKKYPFNKETKLRANEVIKTLERLPLVFGMCSNPRILEIVCKLHQHVQKDSAPLPETLSGMFMKLICHQLEEDLSLRQSRVRIKNLLKVPENLFPGFYQLCEVAYECCLKQRLIFTEEDLDSVKQCVNKPLGGSIYNLLFSEEVNSPSPVDGILYQCDHKTVQETLAAVHIGHLTPSEQEEIWKKWFQTPHMALVWRMYCGVTELKFLELSTYYPISRSLRVKDVIECEGQKFIVPAYDELLMLSLFETNNRVLASKVLSDVFSDSIAMNISNQYDVAVVVRAISHHPRVEKVFVKFDIDSTMRDSFCEPLIDCLKNVKSVELHYPPMETLLAVLSGTVEELRIWPDVQSLNLKELAQSMSLADAVESSHCLKSLHLHFDYSLIVSMWRNPFSWRKKHFSHLIMTDYMSRDARLQVLDWLKKVYKHPKCVTLHLTLLPQDWSAALIGLKVATSLKTLSLRVVSEDTDVPYRMTAEDVPNRMTAEDVPCRMTAEDVPNRMTAEDVPCRITAEDEPSFCCELEEVIATTLSQLVKVDVSTDSGEESSPLEYSRGTDSFTKKTMLSILQGAVKNMNITHLSLQCQQEDIPELLPVLSSSASAHITNVCLDCHGDSVWWRPLDIGEDWIHLLLAGPMSRPICQLRLPLSACGWGLLLSKVAHAEHLRELTLVLVDFSGHRISDSRLHLQEVEKSIANCGLRKLHIELEFRFEADDNDPGRFQLSEAVLRGLASNPNQMDFVLFGENLDAKKIIGKLPLLAQSKFEIEKFPSTRYSKEFSFTFIFPCWAGPSRKANVASSLALPRPPTKRSASTNQQVSGTLPPAVKAPRYFNSKVFMKKYSSFPNKVKAKSIALELKINEAIGAELFNIINIDQTSEEKAGLLLYQELLDRGIPSQIRTVCEAMRDKEGNPQMNQLGRDMLDDEDLLLPPT